MPLACVFLLFFLSFVFALHSYLFFFFGLISVEIAFFLSFTVHLVFFVCFYPFCYFLPFLFVHLFFSLRVCVCVCVLRNISWEVLLFMYLFSCSERGKSKSVTAWFKYLCHSCGLSYPASSEDAVASLSYLACSPVFFFFLLVGEGNTTIWLRSFS